MMKKLANTMGLLVFVFAFSFLGHGQSIAAEQMDTSEAAYHIKAGSLKSALEIFRQTSGVNLTYSDNHVEGKTTDGVYGKNTAAQALKKILKGTGLIYTVTSSGMVVLKKKKAIATQKKIKTNKKKNFNRLEKIVVKGDKAGRDLQELPTSASVFDAERVEDEPIEALSDVFNRMANVTTALPAMGMFSIRGVTNNGFSGNNNPVATVFINQVPLGNDLPNPSMWDVSSVEVLRGPQSTMQGPNSLIGAAFINYKRPDFTYDGKVRGEYGQYTTWNAAFYQNLPIVEDMLAARISAETRNSDGAVENTVLGTDDIDKTDERMVRGQVLFQPFKNKDASFNLTAIYHKTNSDPLSHILSTNHKDRKTQFNLPGEYPNEIWLLALESEIKVNEEWKILAVTGYSDWNNDYHFDADFTSMPILEAKVSEQQRAFNQDLRLQFTGQRLRGLLGAYYSNSKRNGTTNVFGQAGGGGVPIMFNTTEDKVTTAAVYTNVDYDILPRLTVNAGLRYNYEDRENATSTLVSGVPVPLDDQESFTQLLPSISLTYRFTDDISAGLTYGRGYRSGGIKVAAPAQKTKPFDAEFTNNYELFFRSQFMEKRLTINSNIYYTDWYDKQVPVRLPGGTSLDTLIENAGEAVLKGFELETTFRPMVGLTCFANLGYAHTEFKKFVANGVDYAGDSFPNAPEWTFTIGANYNHSSGFFAGGSYRWTDKTHSLLTNPEGSQISARSIVDAKAGYRANHWSIYLWGTNLLDDDYMLRNWGERAPGRPWVAGLDNPRIVGIGAEIYW